MYLVDESEYISGLVRMASSMSDWMGPSFMDAICFKKNCFLDNFSNFYNIKKEDIKIHENSIILEEFVKDYFGDDKKIIEGLSYWIRMKVGYPIKAFEQDDDSKLNYLLSESKYGKIPFYTVENVIFIEFDKMIIAFITGNNE